MEIEREENAVKQYLNGLNCAQSVLLAFNDCLEIDAITSQKLASAFGGGMGEGKTCGVITGGLMVLGLKYGYAIPVDENEKMNLFEKVESFKNSFTKTHKSFSCKDLISYDISIPEEKEQAIASNTFNTLCPEFVREAVTILRNLI